MTSRHPGREALEAYVLDALDPLAARALEQHVRCCDRCAEALAAEARREAALGDLVPRVASARRQDPAPASQAASNPWLSPFLLSITGALGLVLVAASPGAMPSGTQPQALLAQAICEGPAADPSPLLCLDASGGEAAMCSRPMSVELGPGRDPGRSLPLFSCSGCSCPAEPLR